MEGFTPVIPPASRLNENATFADTLKEWYDMGKEERDRCGMLGHEFVMSDDAMMSASAMCRNFVDHMNTAFDKWSPRKRYTIFKG